MYLPTKFVKTFEDTEGTHKESSAQSTSPREQRLGKAVSGHNFVHEKVFRRNMTEKDVRIQMFLYEELSGFEDLSLRQKFASVIRSSVKEIQEAYYEIGIKGELPKDWNSFVEFM